MSTRVMMQSKIAIEDENSASTNEFLNIEKKIELYKDSDEEIKSILNELKQITHHDGEMFNESEGDDVELILKRAENIALETEQILKSNPVNLTSNGTKLPLNSSKIEQTALIPLIRVTHAKDESENKRSEPKNGISKPNSKENAVESRRKLSTRPFSASVIDNKRKESYTRPTKSVSPKKTFSCKHEDLIENLKDTNERMKNVELLNVKLNDDNKALRKALDTLNIEKQAAELKLVDCDKFINRLSKEYEMKKAELETAKESENKCLADLNRERNDKKEFLIQNKKDSIAIQDLQRQCKEMEMILKRKYPDSVSALIVAAKPSTVDNNKRKLLEERIARLEQELKDKEDHFQGVLLTIQEKFGDMKHKYENHIIDVERQLMADRKMNTELKNKINKSNLKEASVQTAPKAKQSISTQTFLRPMDRASSSASRLSQSSTIILNKLKEDSYLIATIKGLQSELTIKQRTIAKINRETEELRKNLRNLQKEKEVLMSINPQKKQNKHAENAVAKVNLGLEAELIDMKTQKENLVHEKNKLLDSLKWTNEEYILLKKKRIQDLHTLQLAHEKELMEMNLQLYPLQEEIQLLNRTVEILQDRLSATEDKLLKYQGSIRGTEVNAGGDCIKAK